MRTFYRKADNETKQKPLFKNKNPKGRRLHLRRLEVISQELNHLNPTKTPDGLLSILGFLSYSQHIHLVAYRSYVSPLEKNWERVSKYTGIIQVDEEGSKSVGSEERNKHAHR